MPGVNPEAETDVSSATLGPKQREGEIKREKKQW